MDRKVRVGFSFLVLTFSFLAAKTVSACVCPNTDDTVLGKFEDARFVVIARVAAVQPMPQLETVHTKIVIEKVYKGNLRVGQEMILVQGGSCVEDFDKDHIGVKFLLYLRPKLSMRNVWQADRCGGSKPLPGFDINRIENAADDLSYLEKMDQVAGKTRLSGTLIFYQWSPTHGGADFKRIAGRKVRLIGEKEVYEAETNEDGVYEIYDLPPGRYRVEPNISKGWAIDKDSAWGGRGSGDREDSRQFQLTLQKGRHAYFDFFFKVDNRLRGRVFNPVGNPMKNVCVNLLPTEGKVSEYFKKIDCTNQDGSFEIDEIPFGSYLIVVNHHDRISSYQPFRRFYYPNVSDRRKATIVDIVEGHDPATIDIQIPEMQEVVALEGIFLSSDGKPVTRAPILFKAENTDQVTEGDASTQTDDNGRFSLRVLKGLTGKLSGEVSLDPIEFSSCPLVVSLLKTKKGINWLNQRTEAVGIQVQGNVDNMALKLEFPSCKGGKIVSQMRID